MSTLRWAVCGAGGMAGRKIVSDGLLAASNCELAAVQSWPEDSAREEGARYGVPGYLTVEEMLEKTDCDAVYIASPQFLHLEQVKLAAKHGKHVLCEKPLATNVEDVREIVNVCRQAGVTLGTDFNYRFHPLHQKMKELIAEGAIGNVVSGRCQFGQDFPPKEGAFRQNKDRSGGGALGDTGNHAADLLEYVTGRTIISVQGLSKNTIYNYETEDSVCAILEFAEGGFGIMDAYFCCPIDTLRNDLEINGTTGTLHSSRTLQMDTVGTLTLRMSGATTVFECPSIDMYQVVFEKFADAVLTCGKLPATGDDGLHSQILIEAVYNSSKTGTKVSI